MFITATQTGAAATPFSWGAKPVENAAAASTTPATTGTTSTVGTGSTAGGGLFGNLGGGGANYSFQ